MPQARGAHALGRRALGMKPRGWSGLTVLLLWLALAPLVWCNALLPDDPISFHAFSLVDFRDSVWIPVDDFARGGIPWERDGFTSRHPGVQFFPVYVPTYWYPAALLLLLPYRLAAVLWTGVQVFALVSLWHRSLRLFAPRWFARWPWLVAVVTALSLALRPVQTSLAQGNWAILCGSGVVMALQRSLAPARPESWPQRRIDWWAVLGVVLALVKPPVGIPLMVVMVAMRRTREALVAFAIATAASIPVCLVVWQRAGGFDAALRILERTISDGDGATLGNSHYTRVDVLATLARIPALNHAAPLALAVLVTFVLTAGLAAWGLRRGAAPAPVFSSAALAVVLVAPNLHYSLVSILPVLVGLFAHAVRLSQRGNRAEAALSGAAWFLATLACLSPVRGSAVGPVTPQMANLAWALCLLLAALVLAVLLWREVRTGINL